MPKIQIDHNSSLPAQDSYEKIKDFFVQDQDLKKMDPSMQAIYDDKNRKGEVKGNQFKASIAVLEKGKSSLVQIAVDLPLLLTPFKGKIEETLRKKLNKDLA